jgi:hypothetical protein
MTDADAAPPAGVPLGLAHQARIEALLAPFRSPLSEASFANLYLFRRTHDYRIVDGEHPCLTGRTYDGERQAMPLCKLTPAAADAMLALADCVYPVGEQGPEIAARLGLACDWREADSDYVYDAARLASLAGAKAKRAQARAFAAEGPGLEPVDGATLDAARSVLDGWLSDVARPASSTDYAQCLEALSLSAELGLDGLLVRRAGGSPAAFLLASSGPDGGRIVHFAKGRRSHPGAYPWMFARFAERVGAGRINFEQDLGSPGFAQAKRAFAPAGRLRKHRLRRTS